MTAISTAKAKAAVRQTLDAAFRTNDLQCICRAIDAAVLQSGGVTQVARAAKLDRVTLYRAFRLGKGPRLDNMIKVLGVLGFGLVVEVSSEMDDGEGLRVGRGAIGRKRAAANARRFTAAFKIDDFELLGKVFKEILYKQENVSEFADKTIRTREALYRAFDLNPMPRFSTLLSFLNALELEFAVRLLPRSETPLCVPGSKGPAAQTTPG